MIYIKDKIREIVRVENKFSLEELNIEIINNDKKIGKCSIIILRDNINNEHTLQDYLDQADLAYLNYNFIVFNELEYGTTIPIGNILLINAISLDIRGKFIGTNIMKEILLYAKESDIDMVLLSPQPIHSIHSIESNEWKNEEKRLYKWYQKLGFSIIEINQNHTFKYMKYVFN